MFIENKYAKKYWELVEFRKDNVPDGYTEKHHIIPKSLGGKDKEDNLVALTSREHFFAHRLLSKMTEGESNIKMMWAVHRMLHSRNYHYSSRTYERLRNDHILFMKENHHAYRIKDWGEKMSAVVKKTWEDAEERKKQFSSSMKAKQAEWKKDPNYYSEQIRRAKKGAAAMIESCAKRIEYNGEEYLSWKTFTEETGISRHLYNKFYKFGIDPAFRVGEVGIMDKKDIMFALNQFCESTDTDKPTTKEEYSKMLTRMQSVGIINSKQIKLFMESL